jgi:hypothetical protein
MRPSLAAAVLAAFIVLAPAARADCPDPEVDSAVASLPTLAGYSYDDSDGPEAEGGEGDENAVAQPDTTITVRPGTSLDIENFSGPISVKTWDKNEIKIAADHGLRDHVTIERTGSTIRLKVKWRRWVPGTVHYRIVAPRWMKLGLSGVNTSVDIQDSGGEIHVETVQGNISLKGSTGFASLSSVQGGILAQDVRGRVEASSVNETVRLSNVTGPIFAESVNGGIEIQGASSDSVDASTVNGPVLFEGQVSDRGFYRFATHNGCIDVAMPERSNATVSLSTFSGGIDSSFPVTLKKIKSRRFETTLGTGRAKFELESFQGTIFLRRPGEARANCDRDDEEDNGDKQDKVHNVHKGEKSKKGDKEDSDDDSGDDE